MWSSKISNAVGSRTPGLTRDTLREELQLFAKDSFREELDLLKRELEESFQQRLEIFRHELEAFFQTWAYELVRTKSSKQSFVEVLSDSHGAFRERKSNRGGASSTALSDNPETSRQQSDSTAKKISRHSQRIFSGKTRFAKEVMPHSELDSDDSPAVMATSSLTTGWMNRHRRSSGYGTLTSDGQATGSIIERHLSSSSFRRSQANSSAMPQSWMYRPRRSSGTSAELKDLIQEYRMSEQEKKPGHSTGDIVAAIVKPFQRSNMTWLKRHADSYRQLQLTQETVLQAVCPTESPAASYSLIPAPIEVDRRSALSSSSLLSQDIEMGGSLSSTTVANFAGAGDIAQPADKPKPLRRTFTWAAGNDEDGLLGGGGLDDIDDVGAAIKSMKSHKTNNNAASSGAKPSLKRGFTMNRGQGKSIVENSGSHSQTASRRSNRRGSDDGFATDHFQHHHQNTSNPTAHHVLECQRHSGNLMHQAFPEGSHETNHHGDSHEELLPFSEDVVLSESNRESESEGGEEYGEVILVERLAELINSPTFTYVLTSMILVNSMIFGFETDWKAQNWSTSTPLGFSICDYLFCTLFVFEIGLRICVYGCAFFSVRWNVFDFTVVSLQLAHQVLSGAAESDNVSNVEQIVPVLLMARLFRIFRAASMAHLFSELRMLIISIVDSLKSICWAMILLVVVTYVSSVYFTQVVTIHKVRHGLGDMEQAQSLEMHYGSLSKSMISLFECVSNGISWHEVMDPLIQLSGPFMTIVFVFYITFTMFVVLNVITGIFVETATQKANEDKKKVLMLKLKEFFHHADSDGSGTMTWEKFERQLEIPEMKVYLKAIDLDQEEAWDLFQLLDMDDSNEIDIEEFVNGCLRLHGEAKALDLATFMYNYKEWTNLWTDHVDQLESTLSRFEDLILENSLQSEQILKGLKLRHPSWNEENSEC